MSTLGKLKSDYIIHFESDSNRTVRIQQDKERVGQKEKIPLTTHSGIQTAFVLK